MEGTQCHPSIWLLKAPVNLYESHYTDLVYLNMYMVHMIKRGEAFDQTNENTHTEVHNQNIAFMTACESFYVSHDLADICNILLDMLLRSEAVQ